MSCMYGAIPRQGSVDRDAIPVRATCVCGRTIVYVDGLVNQAPYWRHLPRGRVIR